MAAVFGVRASVISGGVLCVVGVLACGAVAAAVRALRRPAARPADHEPLAKPHSPSHPPETARRGSWPPRPVLSLEYAGRPRELV